MPVRNKEGTTILYGAQRPILRITLTSPITINREPILLPAPPCTNTTTPTSPNTSTFLPNPNLHPGTTTPIMAPRPPPDASNPSASTHHPSQPSTSTSRLSTVPSSVKSRQQSHLHAQLAQLQAHLADLENLLRMTAVQAEYVRGWGGYAGGLFMAASKVLGEETVGGQGQGQGQGQEKREREREREREV